MFVTFTDWEFDGNVENASKKREKFLASKMRRQQVRNKNASHCHRC